MPLRDKIGQMLMVGFHGRSLADSPELPIMVGDYHVGGVVLVESNAHDPQQISRLTTDLQSLATSVGQGIPLFIAINQEGGIVVRITEGATGFPGNMAVAATNHPDYAYLSAALTAHELRVMGVNMNLAPVLDINDNPLNPIMTHGFYAATSQLQLEAGEGPTMIFWPVPNALS
jgi:beta-N-acetylhexosaminidase